MTHNIAIREMTRRVAVSQQVIEESRRYIRYMVDHGMNSAQQLRELAQLERTQRSQEEMLDLARVFAAMERDPKKG